MLLPAHGTQCESTVVSGILGSIDCMGKVVFRPCTCRWEIAAVKSLYAARWRVLLLHKCIPDGEQLAQLSYKECLFLHRDSCTVQQDASVGIADLNQLFPMEQEKQQKTQSKQQTDCGVNNGREGKPFAEVGNEIQQEQNGRKRQEKQA